MKETTHVWTCSGSGDPEDRTPPCQCFCNVAYRGGKKIVVPTYSYTHKACKEFVFDSEKGHLETYKNYVRSLPDDPNAGVCY